MVTAGPSPARHLVAKVGGFCVSGGFPVRERRVMGQPFRAAPVAHPLVPLPVGHRFERRCRASLGLLDRGTSFCQFSGYLRIETPRFRWVLHAAIRQNHLFFDRRQADSTL